MSATEEATPGHLSGASRHALPRGTIELSIRWLSSALVLAVGIALLTIPGVAESGVGEGGALEISDGVATESTDPELRLVRLSAGVGLILLLLLREMFVWFGARRP